MTLMQPTIDSAMAPGYVARSAAAAAVMCALLSAPPAWAQATSDSTRLPTVVITADRLPRPLASTTASVTIVSGEALRAAGITQLADALRAVPGVGVVSAGSAGAQSSLFIRGGESDYVRVFVDGVPMNDPGGAVDLATITTDDIERMEIVRGPASVLYGSDAVTGVVQLFTRQARRPMEARLAARVGTYGAADVDGSLGVRRDGRHIHIALADHRSDGMLPFNNDYRNRVATLRAGSSLPGATTLSVTGRYGDNRFAYPTDGSGNVVDRNAHRSERRFSSSVELTRALGERGEAVVSLGALELHGRTSDLSDSPADTVGFHAYRSAGAVRRRHAEARVNLRAGAAHTVTVGVEYASEGQRSADSSNYDVSLNRFGAARLTRAAFAQLLGGEGRLSYSVGARYDDNDVYGVFRTARAGVALRLWQGGRLRASAGGAFKAPTFFETFSTAFSIGNAALRPERSRSWEGAIEQRFADGRLALSATWFDQRFRDLIQYTFRAPTDPNYFNVAAASARGIEGEMRLAVASGVDLFANATALRTRVDDAGFDEGNGPGATFVRGARLLRRPPLVASAGASIDRLPRTTLQLSVTRVGPRDDRDFAAFPATAVELAPYVRADLAGDYRLGTGDSPWRAAAITWRIENAFDAGYEEIARFRAPGRVLLAGFRLGTAP